MVRGTPGTAGGGRMHSHVNKRLVARVLWKEAENSTSTDATFCEMLKWHCDLTWLPRFSVASVNFHENEPNNKANHKCESVSKVLAISSCEPLELFCLSRSHYIQQFKITAKGTWRKDDCSKFLLEYEKSHTENVRVWWYYQFLGFFHSIEFFPNDCLRSLLLIGTF